MSFGPVARLVSLVDLCSPSTFFAANKLKAMQDAVHIAVDYDVKFENGGVRPPNKWLGILLIPNPTSQVLCT